MPQGDVTAAPASAEHSTLYLAIEISQKSWVVGVKSPTSEKIGLHSLGPADKEGLGDLIENQRAKGNAAVLSRGYPVWKRKIASGCFASAGAW